MKRGSYFWIAHSVYGNGSLNIDQIFTLHIFSLIREENGELVLQSLYDL